MIEAIVGFVDFCRKRSTPVDFKKSLRPKKPKDIDKNKTVELAETANRSPTVSYEVRSFIGKIDGEPRIHASRYFGSGAKMEAMREAREIIQDGVSPLVEVCRVTVVKRFYPPVDIAKIAGPVLASPISIILFAVGIILLLNFL